MQSATRMPCNHCGQPRCRLCWLYQHDARYRRKWLPPDPDAPPDPQPTQSVIAQQVRPKRVIDPNKPRINIAGLVEKNRDCLPCQEKRRLREEERAKQRAIQEQAQQQQQDQDQRIINLRSGPVAAQRLRPTRIPRQAEAGELTVARPKTWACGVTTVPQRRTGLLPETLASIKRTGFPDPVLFVDGIDHRTSLDYENEFNLPVVNRWPPLKTFGNWILGLAELYIRNPTAWRYVMFQDDLVCSDNLREYLDQCEYPTDGYMNLYTFDVYWRRAPRDLTDRRERREGWYPSTQKGLGAVALVFDRDAVWDLITEKGHIVTRPAHAGERRWKNIDGGIVDAMKKKGRQEYVHNPSLVQHRGMLSTMGSGRHPIATSFRGEDFNCLTLLTSPGRKVNPPGAEGVVEGNQAGGEVEGGIGQTVSEVAAEK